MVLDDAGQMVQTICNEIPQYYGGIDIDAFQIMPNHIHGVIVIVGADHRVCPCQNNPTKGIADNIGQSQEIAPTDGLSLGDVVQRFKSLTTNQYIKGVKQNGWQPFNKKLWQRNYGESHAFRRCEHLPCEILIQCIIIIKAFNFISQGQFGMKMTSIVSVNTPARQLCGSSLFR